MALKRKKKSELSRQRLWQIEQVKAGLCMICGNEREEYAQLCNVCQEVRRRRIRKKGGFRKRKVNGVGRPRLAE